MAGVQNVVAPQGTAFTAEHARIIKRYVEEVVLCFDSDEAGQNAAVRSLDHLLASGLAVRVAVVPAPSALCRPRRRPWRAAIWVTMWSPSPRP